MKIAILGYSGSGKSTLAAHLGAVLGVPVLHLDQVQFLENWRERDRDEARAMVAAFLEQPDWIIDGNYTGFYQAERLAAADRIIYMDFSRIKCLFRVLRRYRQNRGRTRADAADGCIEKIDAEFLWWVLHEGRTAQIRQKYREILRRYGAKAVVVNNQAQLDLLMADPAGGLELRGWRPNEKEKAMEKENGLPAGIDRTGLAACADGNGLPAGGGADDAGKLPVCGEKRGR